MRRRTNFIAFTRRCVGPIPSVPAHATPPSHLRVITEWHAVACVLDQNAKVEALLVPKQNESGTRMGGGERRNGQSTVSHESFVRSFGWVIRGGPVARLRLRLPLSFHGSPLVCTHRLMT